jgi:DNA-binding transcriptional regulator YdaS (Cro superfamily)
MDSDLALERAELRRAADNLGGQAALASVLGYGDRRNVAPWFRADGPRFPAEHCPKVERALRALGDPSKLVTCEQLRRDVPWDVLRMQAA